MNFIIIVVTVVVPRVCVCVPVRSFYRHVHLDPKIFYFIIFFKMSQKQ